MTGTVVIRSNSITLGFVRARYAEAFRPKEMDSFGADGMRVAEDVIGSSLSELDSSVTYP